jgi:hypothetical protein
MPSPFALSSTIRASTTGPTRRRPIFTPFARARATRWRVRRTLAAKHALKKGSEDAPDNEYGKIVRLLILTLWRRDEIGSLERAVIDKEARLIRLPGARTKSGREHVVPLSDAAVAILDAVETRDDRELVFGSGKGGYSGWSKAKREMDEAIPLK